MSMLVAKKTTLEVMRECQGKNCSCFTDKGFYIQYRNGNVDSMLFVCEDCFNTQYKSKCSFGSFDEEEYQHTVRKQRYYEVNPCLRKILRGFRKTIRCLRIACIVFAILLITVFSIKENPQIRNEYLAYDVHCEINTGFRGFETVQEGLQNIAEKLVKVIKHDGGYKND